MLKTKFDGFYGTLSMEFDGNIVNFKIHGDVIPTDSFYVNFLDTSRRFPEDCCEFSNHFVQEIFSNRNFNFRASTVLVEKGKLEEEKEMIVVKGLRKRKRAKFKKLKRESAN